MRKLSRLEKEVVRWIIGQSTSNMTTFDNVLKDNFFNDTYKMAFLISSSIEPYIPAVLYIKETDEFMYRICISQFLEVVSLIKYLEESGLINVLHCEREKEKVFTTLVHKEFCLQENYVLDEKGTFLDPNDKYIKKADESIIYRPFILSDVYNDFGFKYFFNAIYPTEELRKLVERNFLTEEEEELQIARNSLKLTQESLTLTKNSLDSTKSSLKWTRFAFWVSFSTLLIGASSFLWPITVQEEQFKIFEIRNERVIESIQSNTLMIYEVLDSIEKKLPSIVHEKLSKEISGSK